VLSAKDGIGIDYLDTQSRIQVPTLQKLVTARAISRASLAEEMRKLYVALTRAESRLFIVGSHKTQEEALKSWQQAFQSPNLVLNATSREKSTQANYLDWIGMCLMRTPQAQDLREDQPALGALAGDAADFRVSFATASDLAPTTPVTQAAADWLHQTSEAAQQVTETAVAGDQLKAIMDFQYPHQAATVTTAYQSVSEAKRLFEDPDNARLGRVSRPRPADSAVAGS
jgi:hypothetical protein